MEQRWVPPGPGFSDEWIGFHRSAEKRQSGRFYAKCKYCDQTMDGRLPNLRRHKINCEMFGSTGVINEVEGQQYEYEAESEDPPSEDMEAALDNYMTPHEVYIKPEPHSAPAKRKKISTPSVTPPQRPKPTKRSSLPQVPPVMPELIATTPQSSTHSIGLASPRGRFTDIGQVWERKLAELPLLQALKVEKQINDLLYEATLSNLPQVQIQPQVIKVAIGQPEDHP